MGNSDGWIEGQTTCNLSCLPGCRANCRGLVDKLLEKIWDFVAKDRSLTLQSRMFRLLCLSAAVICLGLCLPSNLLEPELPLSVDVCTFLAGILGIFCYVKALRGREYTLFFLLVLCLPV